MATEVLELSVKTNIGQSITSLKELKDAIKAAKDEQIAMANQFGATSQEAINASKRLAELQDSVDDLNDSSKSLKGSGFEMLKQGFSQIREGLMNLDFDKVKVGLTGMGSGFTAMGQQAKAAFMAIKGAIGATGIGLLVIAIGTIYAYWDDIKGVVSGVTSEQKKLNAEAEKNVKSAQDNLDIISQQENILKLQGKSEKEILNMKIAATAEAVEETKIKLHQQKATRDAQIDAAKRNKTILEGAIAFVSAPIMLLLKGIDLAGKALGKDFGLAKGFTGSIAGLVFDPDEVAANVDASIAETEKGLRALENASAGHKLAINNINKEADQKEIDDAKAAGQKAKDAQKAIDDARIQAAKDLEAELKDIRDEAANQLILDEAALLDSFAESQLTEQQREQNAIYAKYYDIIKAKEKNGEDILELETNLASEIAAVQEKYGKEEIENEKAVLETKKAIRDANVSNIEAGFGLLKTLAGENEGLQAGAIIGESAAGVARTIINTQTSNAATTAQGAALAIPTAGASVAAAAKLVVANNISAGIAIATNIAATAKALSQLGGGGGAGGSSSGGSPAPTSTTPAPQMMSGAFELGGGVKPEPMKAFVVTDEMSNSQSQLANIRRRATI
jgi:hypothetical protein